MKWATNLLKKQKNRSLKVWNDIEFLPVWNWIKANETKDSKYLFQADDYSKIYEDNRSRKALLECFDSYIDHFGVDEMYRNYIKGLGKIQIAKFMAYLKEDKTLLTFAEIDEIEHQSKYPTTESDYNKTIVLLEKKLGFLIDKRKMTTKEFYLHLRNG